MLEYRRYSQAAQMLSERSSVRAESCIARRPFRQSCGARRWTPPHRSTSPIALGLALGDLLTLPPAAGHAPHPDDRLAAAQARGRPRPAAMPQDARLRRGLRPRGPLHPGGHPLRAVGAVSPGEATWTQKETFGRIEVHARMTAVDGRGRDGRGPAVPLAGPGLGGRAGRGDRGGRGGGRGRAR